ncbi:MAG: VOC family protein [Kiritimatiellae bacterium]|nr:VOC family protein [Kiritimatiellia bacterium]
MPMTVHFEHVAMSVADLERSVAFYVDLLGFEQTDVIECPASGRLGEVVGLPHCSARIVKLRHGNLTLELFAYASPRGRPATDRCQADLGLTHLGFATTDIHAEYERLRGKGVTFYGPPVEYRPRVWNVYFYGPDGETCEFRQVTQ